MLAVVFWWSLVFAMFFEVARDIQPSHPMIRGYYILLFPIPLCSAIGALFAKMRSWFIAGTSATAVMLVILVWHERFSR